MTARVTAPPAACTAAPRKVNLDAVTLYKDTPLHMAARNNRVDFVKQLVAAGADKTKVNMAGDTPAMLAARYKFEGVIDALK